MNAIRSCVAGFITVCLALLFSDAGFAQDTTNTGRQGKTGETGTQIDGSMVQPDESLYKRNAQQWSQSLSDEVKLNSIQRDNVNTILIDYQRQRAALSDQPMNADRLKEFNSTYNSRIQEVLEENQVGMFGTYSQMWWDDINSTISNGVKPNKDQY